MPERARAPPGTTLPQVLLAALAVTVLLAPLAVPLALADAGHDGHDTPPPPPGTPPANQIRTPSPRDLKAYYTYYQGTWMHGKHTVTPVGSQYIRQLHGDGEWLAWVDAKRNDIYAYNVAAGDGFYVTQDAAMQLWPRVSDGVVVWEDRRNGAADIYAYFLETGETRRLSYGGAFNANQQAPWITGTYVAWEDDRNDDWDIYVHDLQTGVEVLVSEEGSRDSDPVVVDHYVLWRAYRFNVWDVMWFDLLTGERGTATSDRRMETPPFSNGEAAFFMKETEGGWQLHRWDPTERRTTATGVRLADATEPVASGSVLVQPRYEGSGGAFVAHNLTNRQSNVVTGYLPVTDMPALAGRTLYVPVWNGSHNAILAIAISPAAFLERPTLTIDGPANEELLSGPTRVRGKLRHAPAWGEPTAFVWSLDRRNFTSILPDQDWAFVLDPTGLKPGTYTLQVEAHFKDAPPLVEKIDVLVPARVRGLDLEREASAYQSALVAYYFEKYIGSNPAILALVSLVLLATGLWVARWRLRRRVVRKAVVEYVRPDE